MAEATGFAYQAASSRSESLPLRLSATIMLLRQVAGLDATGYDYRLLMVQRSQGSKFMPGAFVFPGGVVEAQADSALAARLTPAPIDPARHVLPDCEPALRVAAIRELFEESGIALLHPAPSAELARALGPWRKRIHADASALAELCHGERVLPDARALVPWARWVTPESEAPRRFDATFYLAVLDGARADAADADAASSASAETGAAVWLTPGEALARFAAGGLRLAPPQWTVLRELAAYTRLALLLEYARDGRVVAPIMPTLLVDSDAGAPCCVLPGDAAHGQVRGPHADSRNRIVLRPASYSLQRSADLAALRGARHVERSLAAALQAPSDAPVSKL